MMDDDANDFETIPGTHDPGPLERMIMLGLGPVNVRLGEKAECYALVRSPARPTRLIIADSLTKHFVISDIRIDNETEGELFGSIPASMFAASNVVPTLHEHDDDAVDDMPVLMLGTVTQRLTVSVERVPVVERRWWARLLLWLHLRKPYVEPEIVTFMGVIAAHQLH